MLIKTQQDIENIKQNGAQIGAILETLAKKCVPGASVWEIDQLAEKLIRKSGGRPAFKGYKPSSADRPFPATVCVSLNSELVHGIPRKEVFLKDGDIVSLDIGMEWFNKSSKFKVQSSKSRPRGVYTDTAITVMIGVVPEKTQKLLAVTRQALEEGIKVAQPGNSIASIGRAVENYVKSQGKYGIVRDLVGHGVGHTVHEEPMIPNYYDPALDGIQLRPGMVIAIEPMIALGGWRVETMPDGWTIKMADNSLSAHFEHTVIITEDGNVVATRRPHELSS
ncbi:MAG: type I methionyl aminopeptidase [Candidatus Magasanikbacteria bacterium]|nr:type I methionyl aminopeptidase [Candidatus Magasanikbacteria bacterium]